MAKENLIQPFLLCQLLTYDEDTGRFTWLAREPSMFSPQMEPASAVCARWNSKYAGKPALTFRDKHGYLGGTIFNISVKAHRVAWAFVHGEWPDNIDHINGNPSDNRIRNLRNVSHAENMRNIKRRKDNTTGHTGVYVDRTGKYFAQIRLGGKTICLGTFVDIKDAVRVRSEAEVQLGFSANHGRRV